MTNIIQKHRLSSLIATHLYRNRSWRCQPVALRSKVGRHVGGVSAVLGGFFGLVMGRAGLRRVLALGDGFDPDRRRSESSSPRALDISLPHAAVGHTGEAVRPRTYRSRRVGGGRVITFFKNVSRGLFHKDPKLILSQSWTSQLWKAVSIFKILCKSYFQRHKMLIQIIHIF